MRLSTVQELELMGKHYTRLKDELEQQGRSQTWLCKRTGIHTTWMNKLAKGHALPKVDDALLIADLLSVDVRDLWKAKEAKGDDVK